MKDFIQTLLDIISNSPSSVLFIIIGIVFATSMIINVKNKNKSKKLITVLGWLFVIFFIIIRYNSYLNQLFDNLINNIFIQIFFPNLATYIIIILTTNIIFLYSLLSKKIKNFNKIFNIIFFTMIMILMLYTLEQIISNHINIYQFKEVYSNNNILTLIQSTTLLFTLWIIIIINKIIINKLITKSIQNLNSDNKEQLVENSALQNENNTSKNNIQTSNNDNDNDIEILDI